RRGQRTPPGAGEVCRESPSPGNPFASRECLDETRWRPLSRLNLPGSRHAGPRADLESPEASGRETGIERRRFVCFPVHNADSLQVVLKGMALETRQQLLAGHGGSPEFSNNYSRRGIGNFRRLLQGCAGAEGKGKERDGGVSGARHVENFLGARRGMVRRLLAIEKNHAMLAQRDQHRANGELLQETPSRLESRPFQYRVICVSRVVAAGHQKGLGAIWLDGRRSRPTQRVSGVRICSKNLSGFNDHRADAIHETLVEKSLIVVLENHTVHTVKHSGKL